MAKNAHVEAARDERLAMISAVTAPLRQELAEVGLVYATIDDLCRSGVRYEAAIPILLRWLDKFEDRNLTLSLVGTLSVPWAKPAACKPLVALFKKIDPSDFYLRWGIGSALSVTADDSVFDDLVGLVRDRNNGDARQMIVVALGNMKNPAAIPVLIELLTGDEAMAPFALIALGKCGNKECLPTIEPFRHHPRHFVAKEAKKAFNRIGKRSLAASVRG